MRARFRTCALSPLTVVAGVIVLCNIVQLVVWLRTTRSRSECNCEELAAVYLPALDNNDYTWEGTDFPLYLPLFFGPPVSLTIQNTVHYALDDANSDEEWESLYPGGMHHGFVHLGPRRRFFGLSMFHQLHCVDTLRKAIRGRGGMRHHNAHNHDNTTTNSNHLEEDWAEHSTHCLNYLRQTILCSADMTLEPEIPVEGTRDVGEGTGVEHVCRDWTRVYDFVDRNIAEWDAATQSTGVP
ncbi:hypothetical protein EUX98_g4378 [Antrodiella citrinella]|uniref:Uncharacterized protein n=1 Tax=Antrodiella citrinella TaxID=2447956 RepID=A0A4S4MW54_9APHY|nr:hypothetical protein EUX98_g4378 [Antrodiella citrinella]